MGKLLKGLNSMKKSVFIAVVLVLLLVITFGGFLLPDELKFITPKTKITYTTWYWIYGNISVGFMITLTSYTFFNWAEKLYSWFEKE